MFLRSTLALTLALAATAAAQAQFASTYLTDKIYRGSGVIDLLKDVRADDLAKRLNTGTLLFAVDVNEDASGNEMHTALGVAISQVSLQLRTTAGDLSFSDVFSNTSAILKDSSGAVRPYYTLFGQTGSSDLTSSTKEFDLSRFDDLMELRNVKVAGDILEAKLKVAFVSTAARSGASEEFFDFSGGFEDFALISRVDAQTLESAAIGTTDAPKEVIYATAPKEDTILATPEGGGGSTPAAPGAPLPPLGLMLAGGTALALGAAWRRREAT